MTLSYLSPRARRVGVPPGRRIGRAGALLGALTLAALSVASPARAAEPGAARRAAGALMVPMAVQWKFTGNLFPANPAAPVITEDTAYLTEGNRIYAVSLQDGSLKWRYPPESSLSTFVLTTPLLNKDTLYFGAGDGLYALNTADGKMKWRYALKSGVNTSPKMVNNVIYFCAENQRVYAVNAETGDPSQGPWNRGGRPGLEIGGELAGDFAVSDGIAYYVLSNQIMAAVDLPTATPRWKQRVDINTANVEPVISGELIYLAAGNTLSAYRLSNGSRRWLTPLPTDASAPPAVDAEGNVYIVTTDRNVYSVDGRGRGRWKQSPKIEYGVLAAPVVSGSMLIVGTAQGGLYAYDTATGTLKWSYLIQPSARDVNAIPSYTNIMTAPVVSGDSLYVLTDDGTLTAFRNGATDALAPTITILDPQLGDYLNGRPPFHIAVKIVDDGSGVNMDTLTVKLDDTKIPRRPPGDALSDKVGYVFNPDNGIIEYNTLENEGGKSNTLTDGHHTVTVSVADWMGNVATKAWVFTIDDTLPKRVRRAPGAAPGRPGAPAGGPQGGSGGLSGGGRGG